MLRQYFSTKERYPGVLLAMRVGDFYEFYGPDAEYAAKALEITLTGREDGENGRIPMAGVPYHSVEKYLARLLKLGYKVAICDQTEDPKLAKGLVKREVTRVLTPGTALEDSMLTPGSNNFLAAAAVGDDGVGISFIDLSTGEFLVTELVGPDSGQKTIQEIARLNPAECLLPEESEELFELIGKVTAAATTKIPFLRQKDARSRLLKQFKTQNLSAFGIEDAQFATSAAGTILSYLDQNEIQSDHIDHVVAYRVGDSMHLDAATLRSLELTANSVDGGKRMSLLEVIDRTRTPMGARLLKRWLEEPLLDIEVIGSRLDAVEVVKGNNLARGELREVLGKLYDLQRLVSRAATGTANPRDLAAIRESLTKLPLLMEITVKTNSGRITECRTQIDLFSDLLAELNAGIVSEPPMLLREGGVIRKGYNAELDELRALSTDGKQMIAALENGQRERSGIERLRVGYNSVFGYFFEVPKSRVGDVPSDWIRKQTTANAERYITAELKDLESRVMGAEERALEMETQLFAKLRATVATQSSQLLKTARAISEIDALQSFAEAAATQRYVRPELNDGFAMDIKGGRHPVVEQNVALGGFVPNDLTLEPGRSLVILTGPNMSGKSTYLRQCALISLMAQMGSFVPAEHAALGLIDRVFARIGARDELATGQSTFMVEMTEAAHILHHATDRSLVILDEIGRGTSTFDGLAIAWAISEELAKRGTKTLFATHYHQLNRLTDSSDGIVNCRVAVREEQDRVIWLHKVLEGGTDKSYGIQVARMAGVPKSVLKRADEVLADLEQHETSPSAASVREPNFQMTLFEPQEPELLKTLRTIDTSTMTPVEALVLLDNLTRASREDG